MEELSASPEMLVLAREAAGLTQTALAARLSDAARAEGSGNVSQGYVSRAESGTLLVSGDRLRWYSRALGLESSLLVSNTKIWALGEGCIFHRKRARAKTGSLRLLHARMNLIRLVISRLSDQLSEPLPTFVLPQMVVGGSVSPGDIAASVRHAMQVPSGPMERLTEMVESTGAMVVRGRYGAREIDAANLFPPGETATILLNADASPERQRYSLAHELGHTVMEVDPGRDIEAAVDQFASELLLPAADVRADLAAMPLTLARLRQLKTVWKVSAAALARRALDLGVITENNFRKLMIDMATLGWRTLEPDPQPLDDPARIPDLLRRAALRSGGLELAMQEAGVTPHVFRDLFPLDAVLYEDR